MKTRLSSHKNFEIFTKKTVCDIIVMDVKIIGVKNYENIKRF